MGDAENAGEEQGRRRAGKQEQEQGKEQELESRDGPRVQVHAPFRLARDRRADRVAHAEARAAVRARQLRPNTAGSVRAVGRGREARSGARGIVWVARTLQPPRGGRERRGGRGQRGAQKRGGAACSLRRRWRVGPGGVGAALRSKGGRAGGGRRVSFRSGGREAWGCVRPGWRASSCRRGCASRAGAARRGRRPRGLPGRGDSVVWDGWRGGGGGGRGWKRGGRAASMRASNMRARRAVGRVRSRRVPSIAWLRSSDSIGTALGDSSASASAVSPATPIW